MSLGLASLIIALVAGLAVIILAAFTAWAQMRTSRRTSSGRVSTSQADQIFAAQDKFIGRQADEITSLTVQRDKLITVLEDKVLPALEVLSAGQQRDGVMLGQIMTSMAAILTRLEEGVRNGTDPAPPVQPAR